MSSVSSAVLRSSSMMFFIFQTKSTETTIIKANLQSGVFGVPWVQIILDITNLRMEQSLPTRLPIYWLIALTTILGSYLFMTWTAEDGLSYIVRLFYYQKQIKSFSQELLIVVNTSYYFALVALVAYAAAEVYSMLRGKAKEEPLFTTQTKNALTVSFHTFIIFVAFFYFLLRNDGDDLSRRYINLLPFWFLSSTIAYLLGAWFERLAKLKLSLVGALMNFMIWLLIAGEIYHNGFIKKALNL